MVIYTRLPHISSRSCSVLVTKRFCPAIYAMQCLGYARYIITSRKVHKTISLSSPGASVYITMVNTTVMSGILVSIFHVMVISRIKIIPSSWCCGGHGPFTADPQTIRSPSLVIMLLIFDVHHLQRAQIPVLKGCAVLLKAGWFLASYKSHTKCSTFCDPDALVPRADPAIALSA